MNNQVMVNQELIEENALLKQKIRELEQSESERKRATEALRESEEYFKTIIKNSSDIIFILDRLGTITYASSSVERFLGYEPDEVIGKRTLDLIVSDDKPKAIADFGRALLTKEVLIPNVFRIRHKNGTEHILEGLGYNLLDNPIVAGFVMNVRDITDRKKMEETLRENEERYRALVENASDIVYRMDGTGHVTYVNPSGLRVTGYEEEELIGKNYSTLIRQDMSDKAMKFFGRQFVKRIKNTYSEYPILTKEGHEVWLGQNTQLIVEDGHVIGFQAVSRDITERKRMEDAIQMREDRAHQQRIAIARLAVDVAIASGDVPTAMQRLTEEASAAIRVERASVWLLSEDDKNLRCITLLEAKAKKHTEDAILRSADYPRYFEAIRAESQINAGDARTDSRTREFTADYLIPLGITSMLDAGIQMEGKLAGVVCFEHVGEKRKWHPDEEAFASTIAALVAQTLANAERKRAEESLKQSEAQYRLLADHMKDQVWLMDLNLKPTYISPSVEKSRGYTFEEIAQLPLDKHLTATSFQSAMEFFSIEMPKALADPTYLLKRSLELEFYHKDGSTLWVESTFSLIRDENGNPLSLLGVGRDITERKRTDAVLRESEKQFHRLADNMQDLVMEVDTMGIIQYISPSSRYLGYEPDEMIGQLCFKLLHPEDQDMMVGAFAEALADPIHPPYLPPYRVITKNGDIIWIEGYGTSLFDKDQRLIGGLIVGRNITARKLDEAKLNNQMAFISTLLDTIPSPIFYNDTSGKYLGCNRAYEEFIGKSKEEIAGKDMYGIYPAETASVYEERDRELYENPGSQIYDGNFKTPDGTVRDVIINKATFTDAGKNIAGLVGVIIDITERKQAEEARRESEQKYRLLAENSVVAIWTINLEGSFTYMSSAIEKLLGYTVDEVMGIQMPGIVVKEDYENLMMILSAELANPKEERLLSYSRQIRCKRKDGNLLDTEINVTWLKDGRGNIVGLQGSTSDITERKKAEEERRVLEERLQRAEKMEALGTLAGGVAHDLNNVLGVVVGYSEMLMMDADKSSSIRPQLVNIMNGGQRAAAIVDDLLTLARRGVPGRSILNLNKIIADCQQSPEFANLSYHHPSVKIKTDIDPDLLNISGSSVHLGKSLYNLISNASEAMAKGGTVTIRTSNQYLDKPIQGYDNIREGDYVVLSVSDTGEGIQTNDLKRIFEPFYTKKVMGRSGTGLGLAVVWGTVKDHHGYINVESEEGKGSTFTLYFPVTREDITAERVAVPISEYMGSGESILVVDDVREQRDLASGMLRTLNYNVASVSSGEEAIDYLKEHQADLMVLDMIMDPGMDGLDTYMSILKIRPKQKAIIVSGFSESDRVRAARDLGAGAYVRKPYIKEKLGLAVRKELERVA